MNVGRRSLARPPVDFNDLVYVFGMLSLMTLHGSINYTMNFAKSYPPRQESRHRHFIRRVEHRRHGAALGERRLSQSEGRKTPFLHRQKVQLAMLGQI